MAEKAVLFNKCKQLGLKVSGKTRISQLKRKLSEDGKYIIMKTITMNKYRLVAATICFIVSIYAICFIPIYKSATDDSYLNKLWIDKRSNIIKRYSTKNGEVKLKVKPVCSVPYLNPFQDDYIVYMRYREATCDKRKYGRIIKDTLVVKAVEGVSYVYIQYIYRGDKGAKENLSSTKNNIDDSITLSPYIKLKKEKNRFSYKLTEDFVKVSIYKTFFHSPHIEHHATLAKTASNVEPKLLKELDVGLPFNVVMYMVDSVSQQNFYRQLIKTAKLLESDENTVIFKGQTIVGDGTTAALSAILTGIDEKDLPETRRGFTNKTCDEFNMIFKDFENEGYVTAYSEKDSKYGSFNYRLNGFIRPPAMWYIRPFFLSYNNDNKFTTSHGVCATEENINIVNLFDKTFRNNGKFLLATSSFTSHNDVSDVQVIDEQLAKLFMFMKKPTCSKNTVFILFADHGSRIGEIRNTLQGKLEERLPFLSITMPTGFKDNHKNLFNALKINSNLLTTPFDIFATLKHIISFPKPPVIHTFGQSLFTEIDPLTRTCESAGVLEHWCPCLEYVELNSNTEEAKQIAISVIHFINSELLNFEQARYNCMNLTLKSIDNIGEKSLNKKVLKYTKTKRDKVCDSCGVVFNDTPANSFTYYQITFIVSPSNGAYEAGAKFRGTKLLDDPTISRINKYGNEPHCIMDSYPHLREFCYCK